MSFRMNPAQQLSMCDSVFGAWGLTERERRALEGSWANAFAEEVFPAIDESRFAVLYDDGASRPNTPVNVIVGALIIKELLGYSDDELVEALMFDVRLQWALHTTSFDEQPLSDKTLSRFRRRCYEHELATGEDLWRDCVRDLAARAAEMMGVDGRVRRMDSMMVDANIRELSRSELMYECLARACRRARAEGLALPDGLSRYLDKSDFNRTFGRHRGGEGTLGEKFERIMADADLLAEACGGALAHAREWGDLCRCMREQTLVGGGARRLRGRDDGMRGAAMLNSPTDPEATFRTKAGVDHVGYVANLEESCGAAGTVVTNYDYDRNTHSDSALLREFVDDAAPAAGGALLVTDGGYDGGNNVAYAAGRGVELVTTDMIGREPKACLADFEWSEDGRELLRCAAGHAPEKCYYTRRTGQCKVSFDPSCCEGCPHRAECRPRPGTGGRATLTASANATRRSRHRRRMESPGFECYRRLRNGAETVPSAMRRSFRLDTLPRGRVAGKLFFGAKVAALNFRKLLRFLGGARPRIAENPLLA